VKEVVMMLRGCPALYFFGLLICRGFTGFAGQGAQGKFAAGCGLPAACQRPVSGGVTICIAALRNGNQCSLESTSSVY
jgi:hypothetical protein